MKTADKKTESKKVNKSKEIRDLSNLINKNIAKKLDKIYNK